MASTAALNQYLTPFALVASFVRNSKVLLAVLAALRYWNDVVKVQVFAVYRLFAEMADTFVTFPDGLQVNWATTNSMEAVTSAPPHSRSLHGVISVPLSVAFSTLFYVGFIAPSPILCVPLLVCLVVVSKVGRATRFEGGATLCDFIRMSLMPTLTNGTPLLRVCTLPVTSIVRVFSVPFRRCFALHFRMCPAILRSLCQHLGFVPFVVAMRISLDAFSAAPRQTVGIFLGFRERFSWLFYAAFRASFHSIPPVASKLIIRFKRGTVNG